MAKRKSEEEKAAAKAKKVKKGIPFTAPKDAATKATYETISIVHRCHKPLVLTLDNGSIAQNAASSPLLRLPLEIRNKIWAAVLGDRLIHLMCAVKPPRIGQPEERQIWGHVVCKHDCRENENIEVYTWIDEENEDEHVFDQSHHHCNVEMSYIFDAKQKSGHESMHLTVLQVCRQIYNEANNTLWSTNVFAFDDATVTFKRFMDARTTHQK